MIVQSLYLARVEVQVNKIKYSHTSDKTKRIVNIKAKLK